MSGHSHKTYARKLHEELRLYLSCYQIYIHMLSHTIIVASLVLGDTLRSMPGFMQLFLKVDMVCHACDDMI